MKYLAENPQVVITLIIGVVGLIITWWFSQNNLKIAHQKMEKDLFSEFNKRYDILNDTLFLLRTDYTIADLHSHISLYNDKKTLHHALIDYFNLCGEQYYWKSKGRISDEIWNSWHAGMMGYYTRYEVVRKVWEEECKEDGYRTYYLKKESDLFKGNI
jgi:hypothetical protein